MTKCDTGQGGYYDRVSPAPSQQRSDAPASTAQHWLALTSTG